MIERLDHVNLRTTRLAEMVAWYGRILGLEPGPRPPFGFAGAWLYGGGNPIVHLVEISAEAARPDDLALEHAAFRATDFANFIKQLDDNDVTYRLARTPVFPIVQVNIWDPDGNHLHVDFDAAEAEGVEIAGFATSVIKPV